MDIIGCRFQEVIDQQKKYMARVSNLYRERVRSIRTVLFLIVSVSLLSGETVPALHLTITELYMNNKYLYLHLQPGHHRNPKNWSPLMLQQEQKKKVTCSKKSQAQCYLVKCG